MKNRAINIYEQWIGSWICSFCLVLLARGHTAHFGGSAKERKIQSMFNIVRKGCLQVATNCLENNTTEENYSKSKSSDALHLGADLNLDPLKVNALKYKQNTSTLGMQV